jgi:glycosyltransferase involved in cell wall biosynthesis
MRICFVALNAFDLISRAPVARHAGGAERQMELLGRGLVKRGHEVYFVTWDLGQADGASYEGIRVFKTCGRDEGLRGIRFLHPRWTSLRAALRRADAQVYFQMMADSLTGQVGGWAKSQGRAFVFAAASNADCDPTLPNLRTSRERYLYRRGLRLADLIVSQTLDQKRMFREQLGYETEVIPGVGPETHGLVERPFSAAAGVLWVGRLVPVKRLEMLLKVARLCPEIPFHVVGASNRDSDYADGMVREAQTVANVHLHGRVGLQQLRELFASTLALMCTSRWEGFPNTFLEAWSVGLPIVSTVDPDQAIAGARLGFTGDNAEQLAAGLRTLLGNESQYRASARRCYEHYLGKHSLDAVVTRHEQVWVNANGPRFPRTPVAPTRSTVTQGGRIGRQATEANGSGAGHQLADGGQRAPRAVERSAKH